jgi:hypothetical protein
MVDCNVINRTKTEMKQIFFRFFLFISLGILPGLLLAQIPSDLSRVKASQITDAQLSQFLQQAKAAGMSEAEMLQEFQKRGLPESEMQAIIARVKTMPGIDLPSEVGMEVSTIGSSAKRNFKGETMMFSMPEKPSRVFGSELFSGNSPFFVPNLKIATPKNYQIGPDDELQLDIYGNNISNQKLTVNPDGNIMVKYLGPVNVSGKTIEQAGAVLKARLMK